MLASVTHMANANIGVTGNGLHCTAEWNCTASRGVQLFLYVLLKMSNFKELSSISDYQCHSCPACMQRTTRVQCFSIARLRIMLSARAISATGSWLTFSRVNECTAETDCTEQYSESC
jgi:hypothetical protein